MPGRKTDGPREEQMSGVTICDFHIDQPAADLPIGVHEQRNNPRSPLVRPTCCPSSTARRCFADHRAMTEIVALTAAV